MTCTGGLAARCAQFNPARASTQRPKSRAICAVSSWPASYSRVSCATPSAVSFASAVSAHATGSLSSKRPCITSAWSGLNASRGAISATGQVCFSIERIYVDAAIHDAVVEKLKARAQKIELNHPDPLGGHIGPFTGPHQAAIVAGHLEDAVSKGATIVEGGAPFKIDGGDYMRPTILTGVTHDMKIMREETFGPCMPVMAFTDI